MNALDHSSAPKVSVIVPTYQHAPFIAQCLDGILSQETTFQVEILVGEDESTDGTREICQRYAAAYPDRIRLFLRSRKDVMYIMGRPTGRANFLDLMNAAKGNYVAICEGDDHWIDPLKLQKQVNALEADPGAAGCFTDAWNEQDGQRSSYMDGIYAQKVTKPALTERDMVMNTNIPFCTILFRHVHVMDLPEVFKLSAVADTPLYVLLTQHGHLLYLPEHTAVRTMHSGGIHSLTSRLRRIQIKEQVWPLLDAMTEGRYAELLAHRLEHLYATAWTKALEADNVAVLHYLWPHMKAQRHKLGWSRARTALYFLRVRVPVLGRALARLTDK